MKRHRMSLARVARIFAAGVAVTAAPAALAGPLPQSSQASNITGADTASDIAPPLPPPPISENAPPLGFLRAAANALAAGRTGEAQEAMERAESRALTRSVRPSQASVPTQQPLVRQIAAARAALSGGDRLRAIQLLEAAMGDPQAGG